MALAATWAGAGLSGCDRPGCDGVVVTNPAAPQVTRFEIVDSFPDDPWTLVLAIDFANASPALRSGNALFYVGPSTDPLRLPLQQPFAQVGLPTDAPSGRLGMLFPLNSGLIQDGDLLRLAVQLEEGNAGDQNGLRSNCSSMDLSFDVRALRQTAQLLRRAAANVRHWLL